MSEGRRTVSKCPACGAPIDATAMSCPYCNSQYVIESDLQNQAAVFEDFASSRPVQRMITAAQIMTANNHYLKKKKDSKTLLIFTLVITIISSGFLTPVFIVALINFILHANNHPTMSNLKPYLLQQHGMPKINLFLLLVLAFTVIGLVFFFVIYYQKYSNWKNQNGSLLDEFSAIQDLTYSQAFELYR